MMRIRQGACIPIVAVGLGGALLGSGALGGAAADVGAGRPVVAQASPSGDIPDTQAFVTFISKAGGYELQVPEGWARTTHGPNVRFADKLDGVQVVVTPAAQAPSGARARAAAVAALARDGRAVQVTRTHDVRLPGGAAVVVEFTSISDPDPVTNRRVRLEDTAYLFFRNGRLATLTVWAPVGADNVDQWQRMARSFRWL
jgi:hypothetical protein